MDESSDTDKSSSSLKFPSSTTLKSSQLVWQIKGQYHLKYSDDEDTADDSSEEVKRKHSPELPAAGEDTSDSDNISSVQALQAASDEDGDDEASTSPTKQRSRRDLQLVKWQTRQVVKAFVDNTINCVLEDMGFGPLNGETEDIISDGNLEHEAVSMAILSHGLQRSVHNTSTTSFPVDSQKSHQTNQNNCSRFCFLDGLPSETKVRTAYDTVSCNSQGEASCSFSSSKPVYQNGDMVLDVMSETVTSEDRIIVSSENITTVEHSKSDSIDALHLQSQSNILSTGGIFAQPSADCDVLSPLGAETYDKLPSEHCSCSFSDIPISTQRASLSAPFHKRKAEEFSEVSKRCCQEHSSSTIEQKHNHLPFESGSSDESVPNVQILYDEVPSFEHFDFMDAAVAVAIERKGLSAMACSEYG